MSNRTIYPDLDFADRLNAAMVANGYSQIALAQRLGRDRKTINRWVNGRGQSFVSDLIRICELLHVTADWLLYGR